MLQGSDGAASTISRLGGLDTRSRESLHKDDLLSLFSLAAAAKAVTSRVKKTQYASWAAACKWSRFRIYPASITRTNCNGAPSPQEEAQARKRGRTMARSTLFKNARLIDGISDQPRDGVSIVVDNEQITAVESGTIPVPAGADVIDLKGQTVLPGLGVPAAISRRRGHNGPGRRR